MRLILLSILLMSSITLIEAQSCCSGGTPLTGNLGIQKIENQEWYFRVGYDYNYLNDLIANNKLLNNNTRNRTTQSILIQTSYGISEKLAVTALFSLVQEQQETFVLNRSNTITQSGLGDAFVMFQYSVISNLQNELLLAVGPKIPLGKTDAKDEQGILLPPDLQPGSGSWDFVSGLSYRQFHLLGVPKLSLNFSTGFKYSGSSTRFEGDEGYRFGNEFITSLGLSKGILLRKKELTPSLQFNYRNTQPDEIKGFNLPSTGGNWFNLIPSISVAPSNQLEISLGGEIPIYRDLTGTQLTTSYRFNLGISYRFKNK